LIFSLLDGGTRPMLMASMYTKTKKFYRVFVAHNHMFTLVLLLGVALLVSGCSQPLPVVYLGLSAAGDESSTLLSQIVVRADDLEEASEEIDLFIRERLADLRVGSEGSHNVMSLSCQIKASLPITLTDPLPDEIWISLRCDLRQPGSERIEKSLNFEYVSSAVGSKTLEQCLSGWLDKVALSLKSVSVRYPYHLVQGIGRDDRQGREQVEQNNYAAALRSFQKAIDAHPEDHGALYNAGLMCQAMNNHRRALGYYKRAYRISPLPEYQVAIDRIEKTLP
jgi:tetratricopeptide (TPR) repeat protein